MLPGATEEPVSTEQGGKMALSQGTKKKVCYYYDGKYRTYASWFALISKWHWKSRKYYMYFIKNRKGLLYHQAS